MAQSPVTIVIPSFNCGTWLLECVRSVLAQTHANWRCIVVDDASTLDLPPAGAPELQHPQVTLLRHPANRGLSAARNTGIRAATTDWVLPVDADDQLHAGFLEAVLAKAESDPGLDSVHTDFQLFGGSDGQWRFPIRTPAEMALRQWIPGPGTLMRRSLWEGVGGYDEHQSFRWGGEDWEFWIAATIRGMRAGYVPAPLYRYRRSHGSMSVTGGLLYDHVWRTRIEAKHRAFFKRHRARRAFLADGYWRSAEAWRARGHHLRGAVLALRGLCLRPSHVGLWHALVGESALRLGRPVKRLLLGTRRDT